LHEIFVSMHQLLHPSGWKAGNVGIIVRAMLDRTLQNAPDISDGSIDPDGFGVFDVIDGDLTKGLILLCDHASNGLPQRYGSLGLPASEFERHIAYDIGVDPITRRLAERLQVPALLTRFSRLLIDPNRGMDDPTLIMKLSDGAVVPGNAEIDEEERERRISTYYLPYHNAISAMIDRCLEQGIVPALLSIHSFTPAWKGTPRPWHSGLLWDPRDKRFCEAMIAALRRDPHMVVGDNEPYRGGLAGDTIDVHGTRRGLASALLEIRQDLIAHEAGVAEWTELLAGILPEMIEQPDLHEQLDF
jgi:predicted N-formylglutamate amidohydrolase